MKTITNNGTLISYNVYGSGPITLLFVHGAYIDQSYWAAQVEFFKNDFTVITMDLAGHGLSGRERDEWSVEGMADDVVALMKSLNLKNVILIGHSLGGDINLIAATKYPDPVIGFIGIDNFKSAATPLVEEFQKQVPYILDNLKRDFKGTNEQYARMALLTPATPENITDRVINDYRNTYEPMAQATMPEFFEMDKVEKERLPLLKQKLNLINVNYFPTNVDALKKNAVKGFELTEIAGTSHYPMIETPDLFNKLLKSTIEGIKGN